MLLRLAPFGCDSVTVNVFPVAVLCVVVTAESTTGALVAGAVAVVTTVSVLEVSVSLDVEEESLIMEEVAEKQEKVKKY
jgi:hypothetical protein